MLILIAESKTMTPCMELQPHEEYVAHTPEFEAEADDIMHALTAMSAQELSAAVKISFPLALKLKQMIYEFPDKSHGSKAIEAFTGVVFKALNAQSMSPGELTRLNDRVRIISSLYGWLRPDDIIKQYRLDFTTPLAPEGSKFAQHWQKAVSAALNNEVKTSGCDDILNLMPGDAERCIDTKRLAQGIKMWKVEFKEIKPGGAVATPTANKLKTLRGKLLRQIIQENIMTPAQLMKIESDTYIADESSCSPGRITFITAAE
ncbi:MAG: YaaA family protein [Bacteroides sp.]|nr:YaaA family protein [Bacteroides sp.]MCM1389690.1 YaaA family protein [Bacteroides sp.]